MSKQLSIESKRSKTIFTKLDVNSFTALHDKKLGTDRLKVSNCWSDSQKIKQFGLPMLKRVSTAGKVSLFPYKW